jgi:ABC-2 type transport system ATP-binding protein
MNAEILINAHNVSRFYGSRCAVNDISFSIKRGEITGFLGPNGAGKSTLMQMVCGVLAATSGSIEIAGHDILEQPVPAKRALGYLPDQPPLYRDCTVDEYLFYCARLRGVCAADVASAVTISKDRCGLADTGKRLIANLSKGYQQRIGIAQAIIHNPPVVVLDEPTSGLDPNQIIEIRELILSMRNDHSIILSTHILAEAESLCDRILILHQGRVVLDKPLAELTSTGTLEQTFHALTRSEQRQAEVN